MDFRLKRLERYRTGGTGDKMELSIPLPQSPTGKNNRHCPRVGCVPGLFQLGGIIEGRELAEKDLPLIRRKPGDKGTTCPYCGHDDEDTNFHSAEDIEAVKKHMQWALQADTDDLIYEMMRDAFKDSGIIKIIKTGGASPPPHFEREDLKHEVMCDICKRTYAVFAAALFCPDCGSSNIHVHFRREMELVMQQIDIAEEVEAKGNAELAYRLLGNAHEDVLTAFESYHKAIYRHLVFKRFPEQCTMLCSKKTIGNRFQNVERGRELYAKFELDPYASLERDELDSLVRNVSKRHLIGHNLGITDETFKEENKDGKLGQTITILAEEVAQFGELCTKVIVQFQSRIPEFKPDSAIKP